MASGSSQPPLIAFYGDDFTGSTDALETLAGAGLRAALFVSPPTADDLARHPGLQAMGVAGMTRSLSPDAMEEELRPAFTALKGIGAPHVHYKVCSTFDSSPRVGSIGRAIDVGASIFEKQFVPLVVAAPALGRYCLFGNLFARMGIGSSGAIYRLDRHPSMSRHPVTPADESDLRVHLAKQTFRSIALMDVLAVARPPAQAREALNNILQGKSDIVLFDGLTSEHLRCIGELLDAYASAEAPLFSVGSSGLNSALVAHWTATGRVTPPGEFVSPGPASQMLVLSGSCSPVTHKQMEYAIKRGFVSLKLDMNEPAAERTAHALVDALKSGRHVILHTGEAAGATISGNILGTALGQIARRALKTVRVPRLLIAGGDTSSYAARALGIQCVEMISRLAPGAPLCKAYAPDSPADQMQVNFKGGQVGAEQYFVQVANGAVT